MLVQCLVGVVQNDAFPIMLNWTTCTDLVEALSMNKNFTAIHVIIDLAIKLYLACQPTPRRSLKFDALRLLLIGPDILAQTTSSKIHLYH